MGTQQIGDHILRKSHWEISRSSYVIGSFSHSNSLLCNSISNYIIHRVAQSRNKELQGLYVFLLPSLGFICLHVFKNASKIFQCMPWKYPKSCTSICIAFNIISSLLLFANWPQQVLNDKRQCKSSQRESINHSSILFPEKDKTEATAHWGSTWSRLWRIIILRKK